MKNLCGGGQSNKVELSESGFSYKDELHPDGTVRSHKRKQSCDTLTEAEMITGKKKQILDKVKAPTAAEINELKDTRNLFHSNLFRLQANEMLAELRITDKYKNFIASWLGSFRNFLNSLEEEMQKKDVDDMQWLHKSVVQLPLLLPKIHEAKGGTIKFKFLQPKEVYLIGSAALQALHGSKFVADVAVTMPAESFQKDNYLNLAYDRKRTMYLAFIAAKMLESKHFECLTIDHLKFNYYANNPLKPVLEIELPNDTAKNLAFRIFVTAEESSFKLSRFVPWNNNIRSSLIGENDDGIPLATPNYNAGVLFDLTMKRNQMLLHEIFINNKNFQDGLILLKVWLQQRQLNVGFSGFHSHILAMLICYLYKQRTLHTNMSSYQVARHVWIYLACSSWNENLQGITLCPPNETMPCNRPTMEQFHAHYDVVFVDTTGFYNFCANLSVEIYWRVRLESKIAVNVLNNMNLNSFQLLFMTKYPIYTQLDHIIKIDKGDIIEQILEIHSSPADRCNYIGNFFPQILKIVTTILRRGLGGRVHSILPIEQRITGWPLSEQFCGMQQSLHIGLILNPEHAYDVLDKGPESFAEGAEKFRKFWGEKAELRRFQDGSITEAVVWGKHSDSLAKKRVLVRTIVTFLLKYHLQVDDVDFEYIADQFDVAFKLTHLYRTKNLSEKFCVHQDTDAEALAINVIRCFDDLARKLHSLTELPLEIVSISAIDPVFRYCDPEPVLPEARCIQDKFYANKVLWSVIQLGISGRWPSELKALRALKTAFYIQIARLLRTKHHCRTKVTLNGVLVLKQGYVFGIEIAHQKEVALLKKEKNEHGIIQYVNSETSLELEKRHYILPKITGALHGLYQLYPSFGAAVMIAKRWLYSQMIDDGLWPQECTELLIASQYVQKSEYQLLSQPQSSFFRFLQLLSFTDWKSELILVNFNNEMNENAISELENRFSFERSSFPPLCIATAYDLGRHGLVWTSNYRPNANVLARVIILARRSLSIIESSIANPRKYFIAPAALFKASREGYDLIIHLKPDLIPNSLAVEFGSPLGKFTKPNFRQPLAGTNFLRDAVTRLREAYSEYAAFFYNPLGGKEIYVVWKPEVFKLREFKLTDLSGCGLSFDGTKVQCKKEVLIEDFKIILKDFYLRIDVVGKDKLFPQSKQ